MADEFRMLIANVYSLPDGPAVTGESTLAGFD